MSRSPEKAVHQTPRDATPPSLDGARGQREIEHGRKLVEGGAERIWGWDTPAGRVRAVRRARLIAEGAGLAPGVRALEIGCGTGLFTELMAKTGAEIVAVDISDELLDAARLRNLPPDRVRFLHKRFEDCDVDGPFDAVVGSSVLHHLEIEPALRRAFELLKPGGVMSFAEPNMLNPQIAIQKNIGFIKRRLGDSPDETAFVRRSFRRLLESVGFTGVCITPIDWLHPSTPRPLIGVVGAIGGVLEAIPLIREFSGSLHIRCVRPG